MHQVLEQLAETRSKRDAPTVVGDRGVSTLQQRKLALREHGMPSKPSRVGTLSQCVMQFRGAKRGWNDGRGDNFNKQGEDRPEECFIQSGAT